MKKSILVTGATGFLGRALCDALDSRGHDVVRLGSKEADLRTPDALDRFNDRKYDEIFHLAAWTQAGDFCLYHPGEQWIINQQINTNVLRWWHRSQSQAKCIAMGTSCSYAPGRELSEENYLDGLPIESLFTYAFTKRMLLVGMMALQRQFGLRYLCVVPSTLYGPGYHTDGRQMHFIFDLIRKVIRAKLHDEPVVLWGDGYQRRELVYLDDFVKILLALNETESNSIINVGAGEERTIREFAGMICRHVGYDPGRIRYDESRYVGATSKILDVRKLRGLLPGLTMTTLEAGLARTIDWFMEIEKPSIPPR